MRAATDFGYERQFIFCEKAFFFCVCVEIIAVLLPSLYAESAVGGARKRDFPAIWPALRVPEVINLYLAKEIIGFAGFAQRPDETPNLMAFVTPVSIDVTQLRQQVQQKLPYYCMPLHIFRLAELPLTPRGKVDKAALKSFAREALEQSAAVGESQ